MNARRTGITLVEVLVVVAIVGVVAALSIPAVQMARESARAAQCRSRLKNLALATANFESSQRRFPGYHELIAPGSYKPGQFSNKCATWAVMLLPYLERDDLYLAWSNPTIEVNRRITPFLEFLYCPTEDSPRPGTADNSYIANAGYYPTAYRDPLPMGAIKPDYLRQAQRGANGVFHDRYPPNWEAWARDNEVESYGGLPLVRTADFRDGLSHTLVFSENVVANGWYRAGGINFNGPVHGPPVYAPFYFGDGRPGSGTFLWYYYTDAPGQVSNPAGPARPVPLVARINGERDVIYGVIPRRPSSFHAGNGVNVAYADGHVEFLSETISYDLYQQLMTPDGSHSDMPNPRHGMSGSP